MQRNAHLARCPSRARRTACPTRTPCRPLRAAAKQREHRSEQDNNAAAAAAAAAAEERRKRTSSAARRSNRYSEQECQAKGAWRTTANAALCCRVNGKGIGRVTSTSRGANNAANARTFVALRFVALGFGRRDALCVCSHAQARPRLGIMASKPRHGDTRTGLEGIDETRNAAGRDQQDAARRTRAEHARAGKSESGCQRRTFAERRHELDVGAEFACNADEEGIAGQAKGHADDG